MISFALLALVALAHAQLNDAIDTELDEGDIVFEGHELAKPEMPGNFTALVREKFDVPPKSVGAVLTAFALLFYVARTLRAAKQRGSSPPPVALPLDHALQKKLLKQHS